jgi:hypothetical protein
VHSLAAAAFWRCIYEIGKCAIVTEVVQLLFRLGSRGGLGKSVVGRGKVGTGDAWWRNHDASIALEHGIGHNTVSRAAKLNIMSSIVRKACHEKRNNVLILSELT